MSERPSKNPDSNSKQTLSANKATSEYFLERFLEAQEPCYEQVIQELGQGKKTTHWIWFIFPQIAGLGSSQFSIFYAIDDLKEAVAYWSHPVLKERYEQCIELILKTNQKAEDVLGKVDVKKLQSSLTLFLLVAPDAPILNQAINDLYAGQRDVRTLQILEKR